MGQRTLYRVAGESLLVDAQDDRAAEAIAALFAGWYLTADDAAAAAPPAPGIVVSCDARPAPVPDGLDGFEVAGGGTCYTDGPTSYVDIDGSIVTIGPGVSDVEVRLNGPLPLESPVLTRAVTYALSAALRRRRRFELHSAAAVDPDTGGGVLIIGPSGSGKSTLAVQLASAGWPFLTDDVVLLGREAADVAAWPLRRCFAVMSETAGAEKRQFLPHDVFGAAFKERCVPATLLFPTLTGASRTDVSRLSAGDAMARLIRMSPWCCYDRATASGHLSMLSALARQAASFAVRSGRDLLEPEASVPLVAACSREASHAS